MPVFGPLEGEAAEPEAYVSAIRVCRISSSSFSARGRSGKLPKQACHKKRFAKRVVFAIIMAVYEG